MHFKYPKTEQCQPTEILLQKCLSTFVYVCLKRRPLCSQILLHTNFLILNRCCWLFFKLFAVCSTLYDRGSISPTHSSHTIALSWKMGESFMLKPLASLRNTVRVFGILRSSLRSFRKSMKKLWKSMKTYESLWKTMKVCAILQCIEPQAPAMTMPLEWPKWVAEFEPNVYTAGIW